LETQEKGDREFNKKVRCRQKKKQKTKKGADRSSMSNSSMGKNIQQGTLTSCFVLVVREAELKGGL